MIYIYRFLTLTALLGFLFSSCEKSGTGCNLKPPTVSYKIANGKVAVYAKRVSMGYSSWDMTAPNLWNPLYGDTIYFNPSQAVGGYIRGSVITKQFDCSSTATSFAIDVSSVPVTTQPPPCSPTVEKLYDSYWSSSYLNISSSKGLGVYDQSYNIYRISLSTSTKNYYIYYRPINSGAYKVNYDYAYNSNASYYYNLGPGEFIFGDSFGSYSLYSSNTNILYSRINGSKVEFTLCNYVYTSGTIQFKVAF
jgi:hypothetical protein